jgi:hypothetical protein
MLGLFQQMEQMFQCVKIYIYTTIHAGLQVETPDFKVCILRSDMYLSPRFNLLKHLNSNVGELNKDNSLLVKLGDNSNKAGGRGTHSHGISKTHCL